jgi:hypothetical protein
VCFNLLRRHSELTSFILFDFFQKRRGDCGMFAIMFLDSLAHGVNPASVTKEMVTHGRMSKAEDLFCSSHLVP